MPYGSMTCTFNTTVWIFKLYPTKIKYKLNWIWSCFPEPLSIVLPFWLIKQFTPVIFLLAQHNPVILEALSVGASKKVCPSNEVALNIDRRITQCKHNRHYCSPSQWFFSLQSQPPNTLKLVLTVGYLLSNRWARSGRARAANHEQQLAFSYQLSIWFSRFRQLIFHYFIITQYCSLRFYLFWEIIRLPKIPVLDPKYMIA